MSLQQALMAMIAAFGLGAHSGALAAPGATELVSAGKFSPGPIPSNDASFSGSISRDGRFIVFISRSTDLVPGDTNDRNDVFVTERATGVTERISVDSNGNQANGDSDGAVISADGRFVVFTSSATNLVSSDI